MKASENTQSITEVRVPDTEQFRLLYRQYITADFPPEERMTEEQCARLREKGILRCHCFYGGEALLGYAVSVADSRSGCLFIEYLAVTKERRGRGIGSEMLRFFSDYAKDYNFILLEVEDERRAKTRSERDTMERRLRFYTAAGAVYTGTAAVTYGVPYRLLAFQCSGSIPHGSIPGIYRRLYRSKLGAIAVMLHIRTKRERFGDTRV